MPRLRRPTNLKHGAYARHAVQPGESIAAFDALHGQLIAEFDPEGPIEANSVTIIARCLWRIRNPVRPPGSGNEMPTLDAVMEAFEREDRLWSVIDREVRRLARNRGLGHLMDIPQEEIDRMIAQLEECNHAVQMQKFFQARRARSSH